jgi:sugar phosphate isomerase/epimerase
LRPRIALVNITDDPIELKRLAKTNGFSGIDWSFEAERLPSTPLEESAWIRSQTALQPLEIRYHCPFTRLDLGDIDPSQAAIAKEVFSRVVRLVSRAGGRHLSIHLGLGLESTEGLSWERTIQNLRELVQFGAEHGVKVCLENLAWGWTARPNLFEKLVRRSGAWVTLDIGHAVVCDAVKSGYYSFRDFVDPHPERILNAHVYHNEIPGVGHVAPSSLDDIAERLFFLQEIGCPWWVIEVKELDEILRTKEIVELFFNSLGERKSKVL